MEIFSRNVPLFVSPFIPHFSLKKQDDTAHKGIPLLPLNLQDCVIIFGFLSIFSPSIFLSRHKISQGREICSTAWEQKAEKEPPGRLQAVASVRPIVSCTQDFGAGGAAPRHVSPPLCSSPLPIPPPETPALFCVAVQGAPQAGGCRQDPSSQNYISSTS